MKPLTVEQLRRLKVGDWLWIKIVGEYGYIGGEPQTGYYQLCHNGKASIGNIPEYITAVSLPPNGYNFEYPDYGTKWVAYKNKEQAEAKGEIVELLCRVGDTVYIPWVWDGESDVATCSVHCIVTKDDGEDFWLCVDLETDDFEFDDKYRSHLMSDCGKTWFTDKPEAERRLAELTKE